MLLGIASTSLAGAGRGGRAIDVAAGQTTAADGSGLWRTAGGVGNSGGRVEDGGERR
jgi:hypothetical protein